MTEAGTGRIAVLAVLLVVLLSAGTMGQDADEETRSPIGREAFEVMRDFFVYDPAIPLDARIVDWVEGETFGHCAPRGPLRGAQVNASL